jgi:hypothetical protein
MDVCQDESPPWLEDVAMVVNELVGLALGNSNSEVVLALDIEPDRIPVKIHDLPCPADDLVHGMDPVCRDLVDTG